MRLCRNGLSIILDLELWSNLRKHTHVVHTASKELGVILGTYHDFDPILHIILYNSLRLELSS
jgi:hypothetical protein